MEGQLVLYPGLLTTLTLETFKWAWRRYVVNDPEYDFPVVFYELMLPFQTAIWTIVLGLAGWIEPVTYDLEGLLQWALAILVSLVLYNQGLKPLKEYRKR